MVVEKSEEVRHGGFKRKGANEKWVQIGRKRKREIMFVCIFILLVSGVWERTRG